MRRVPSLQSAEPVSCPLTPSTPVRDPTSDTNQCYRPGYSNWRSCIETLASKHVFMKFRLLDKITHYFLYDIIFKSGLTPAQRAKDGCRLFNLSGWKKRAVDPQAFSGLE